MSLAEDRKLPEPPLMFDKYVDFIDVYAGIQENEREAFYRWNDC